MAFQESGINREIDEIKENKCSLYRLSGHSSEVR
jgi:hypothetical protein